MDVPQRLEEAGAGRQRSAAGPVVRKEPDPAVEVAAEAEMKKAPGFPGAFLLSKLVRVFAEPIKHILPIPVAVGKTVFCENRLQTKMDGEA